MSDLPPPTTTSPSPSETSDGDAGRRERRLKLVDVARRRPDEFRCFAEVRLESPDGSVAAGRAEMPYNEQNYLRVVSQATLDALRTVGAADLQLRLVALRVLRIFDTRVVAVQVASGAGTSERLLLGLAVAEEDGAWGSARAVLHATNRLLGNVVDR